MIDLTPLDVRKKRGDFARALRGYEREEVDTFLEMVAERMEELVRENLRLQERTDRLEEQLAGLEGREKAVHGALVTAQELREEMRDQARREAELLRREAEAAVERVLAEGEHRIRSVKETVEDLERARLRFLKAFRTLLERNMDAVEVEEARSPLEDSPLEIEFSVSAARERIRERVREERVAEEEAAEAEVGAEADGDVGAAGSEGPDAHEDDSGFPDVEALTAEDEEEEGEDESLWLPSLGEEEAR